MREIRFRGKRIDTGEWVYGYYCYNPLTKKGHIYSFDVERCYVYEVKPKTVGQYTGAKDKREREMYEGDIAVATYGKHYNEPQGLTRVCKVIYDTKTCSFRMAVDNSKVLVSFGDSRSKDIEVIGNIFDNKELLTCETEAN